MDKDNNVNDNDSSSSISNGDDHNNNNLEFVTKGKKKMHKASIYTKNGDKGISQLYDGQKVNKYHPVFHSMGKLDLLSAQIGLVVHTTREQLYVTKYTDQLVVIQEWILEACSSLATPDPKEEVEEADDDNGQNYKKNDGKRKLSRSIERKLTRTRFPEEPTQMLEEWIDEIDDNLPRLTQFILRGGCLMSCQTHLACVMCRESERYIFELSDVEKNPMVKEFNFVEPTVASFINRLSDYLFTLARMFNLLMSEPEINTRVYAKQILRNLKASKTSKKLII